MYHIMKTPYLPLVLATGMAMLAISSTAKATTTLRSPETAHTYADSSVRWHQLRWLPESHQLVATVTFDNWRYISGFEPRHTETFDFVLPGVKLDQRTGVFSVGASRGPSIPVAETRRELFLKDIALLPGAQVEVRNRNGRVDVDLVASHRQLAGNRWVELHH
jgi:hypothetical protein